MIDILYFASFREMLGKGDEKLQANHETVESLLTALAERGDNWKMALLDNPNLQIAVNHNVASRDAKIQAGDEVAFFPPVTGG